MLGAARIILGAVPRVLDLRRALAAGTRRAAVLAACGLAILLLLMAALAFLTVSLQLWLQTFWPSHLAAVAVAGVLLVLSAVTAILAAWRLRGKDRRRAAKRAEQPKIDMNSYIDDAMKRAADSPLQAVTNAFITGLAFGILFGDRNRKR